MLIVYYSVFLFFCLSWYVFLVTFSFVLSNNNKIGLQGLSVIEATCV